MLTVLFVFGAIPLGEISISAEDSATVVDVATFAELSANNKADYVLNITDDIVFTSRITLADGVVINGNGHTASVSAPALSDEGILNQSVSNYGFFYINAGRTNVINDLHLKGGNAVNVENRGTLTMNKVSITNCQNRPFYTNGIAILKDCDISRNYCTSGGTVRAEGGTLVMDGCSVTQNRITSWGAIGGTNTNVYINNTVVANNHSTEVGGLLFRGSSGNRKTVCVMNSTIAGNYSTVGWSAFNAGNYADVYGVNNIIQDNFCSWYAARNNTYIESANATLTLESCLTTASTVTQPSGTFYKYTTYGNVDTAGVESTYSWPHVLLLENSDGVRYAPLSAGSDALSGGVKTYFDYSLEGGVLTVNMSYDDGGVNTPLGGLSASAAQVTSLVEGSARPDGLIGASGTGSGEYYIARLSGGTNSSSNKLKYVHASGISVYGDVHVAGDTPSVVLDPTGYVVNGLMNLTENTDYRDLSAPGDGDVKTYEIIGNSDAIVIPDYTVIPDVTAITYPVTVEAADEYTGHYTLTTDNFSSGDLIPYDINANVTITPDEGYVVAGFEGFPESTYTTAYNAGANTFSFNIRQAKNIKPIIAKLDEINTSDKLYGAVKYKNVTLGLSSDITVDREIALSDGVVINGNGHTVKVPVTGLNDNGIANENASAWSVFTLQKTQIGVSLNNMTIEGGAARAINSTTSNAKNRLSMENVKVTKVNADYGLYFYDVRLAFKNCVFTLNRCSGETWASVLFKREGVTVIDGCSFVKNYGKVFKQDGGSTFINNTAIAGNFDTYGYSIVNVAAGTLYMSNVNVVGNETDQSLFCSYFNGGHLYAINCVIADNFSADRNNKIFPASIRLAGADSSTEFHNCLINVGFNKDQNTSLTTTNCKMDSDELTIAYSYRQYNKLIAADGTPSGVRLPFAVVLTEGQTIPYAPLSPDSDALSGGVKTYFDYTVSGRDVTARMSYDSGGVNTLLGSQTETAETEVTAYVEGGARAAGVIGSSGAGQGEYYTVKVAGAAGCGVSGATVFGDAYALDSPNHVTLTPDAGGSVPLEFLSDGRYITGFSDIDDSVYTGAGGTYTFTPDESMAVIPLFGGDMSDVGTYEKLRDLALIPGAVLNLTNDIEIGGLITVAENVTVNGNGYTVRVPVTGLNDMGTVNENPSPYGVFYVPSNKSLRLSHMTVEGGATTAITSAGLLIMDDVTVQKAYLTTANPLGSISGGGLLCRYITILTNCSIRRNVAAYSNASVGGGIASGTGADIVMDNCSVTENIARFTGGGYFGQQPLHMNNTLFANNRASSNGALDSQFADIMNCTFVGNSNSNSSSKAVSVRGISAVNCVFADNVASSYTSDAVTENADLSFAKNWGDADLLVNCAYGGTVNSDAKTTEINTKNITAGNTLLSYFDNISRDYNQLDGKEGKGHYPHASLFKVDGGRMYYSPLSPTADVLTGGTKTYFDYSIKGFTLTVKMSYMDGEGNITAFGGNTAAYASAEVTTYLEGTARQSGVIGASGAGSGVYRSFRITGGRLPLGDFRGASIFGETYAQGASVSVSEALNSGTELKFKDADDGVSYLNPVRNPDNTYTFTMDRDYAVIPSLSTTYDVTTYGELAEYSAIPNAVLNIMNDITVEDAVALADGVIINGNGYTLTAATTGLNDAGAVNPDGSPHGVFTVAADNSVEIYNLDIYGGAVSAICNRGILYLENVDISKAYAGSNNAAGNTNGGAIYSDKVLILKNCNLSRNASKTDGGAVAAGGLLSADNCSFTENRTVDNNRSGGAIYRWNAGATNGLYLNNCAVVGNTATNRGGGIFNNGYANAYIANCTIAGNAGRANAGQGYDAAQNGTSYIVNTIIADNFYVTASTRYERDLTGSRNYLYNCVYGYSTAALMAAENCKTAAYTQENGSSGIFADYKQSAILNANLNEITLKYPRPVIETASSSLAYAPLATGSLPATGGTKTYFNFSQSTLTGYMSYDADGVNTPLPSISASTVPNDSYLEGGDRAENSYGVIGASFEVDIYYKPRASLTIRQHLDGELEAGTLAKVTITNASDSEPPEPYAAYVDEEDQALDSIELIDTKNNVIDHDESVPGALSRTTKLGMHKGVMPQIKVEPFGARSVSSIRIQRKTGGVYTTVPASSYTVSGNPTVDGYVIYTFNSGVNIGDDYVVDIIYGVGKTLTVKTVILDGNGAENEVDSAAEFDDCKASVTVTGVRYDTNGSAVAGEYAFTNMRVTPNVDLNSFTVTDAPVTVATATNTRVTVNTAIGEGSEYVIANVKAVRDSGDDLHLAVPRTVVYNGNIGTSYNECTLSSLSSSDNVTVIVYLAKMVSYNVSVYHISATGEVINGVPGGSDAYVNVNVVSGGVNDHAIITDQNEGGYYTSSFDITTNPHSRHVSVIQGTKLDIFAQLPGSGEYVIKKVTGSGYSELSVSNVRVLSGNLQEILNTSEEPISAARTYNINLFIEKASSVYTRAVTNNGGVYSAANGTVKISGSHTESGVIPFTRINPPAGRSESTHTYDAVVKSGSFTSEAKCVKDTSLSFTVTPSSYYSIKSVTVKSGAVKEGAQDVAFTSAPGPEEGSVIYTITDKMPQNNNLYIDVEFEPDADLITIENKIEGNGKYSIKSYLFYVDDPDEINLRADERYYSPLGIGVNRFGADLKAKTSVYYVMVTDYPAEIQPILSAAYYDDPEGAGEDILAALQSSYTTRTTAGGKTQYYYYYKVNPEDENPILSSKRFDIRVDMLVEEKPDPNPDCSIIVEQWNRETYDGRYVAAENQTVRFSVPLGSVLRRNSKTGADANPITISSALGYMYTQKRTPLTIRPIPAEGYNVEKVIISERVDRELNPYNGEYSCSPGSDPLTVKIYYSRPMLIVSSTNEGNQGKATVNVGSEMILDRNTFINGTFVTKNENTVVTINPLTYDDNGTTKYYRVASIRIGDAFNNTLTAYSEIAGDVPNDGYTVIKNASGSEYKLTLNNVQRDKYIFIQLVGKESIYQSNLQVNQKIKLAGSDEFIDCTDGYFGSVTVNGTLSGTQYPLNFGSDVSSYTFSDTAGVTGTVLQNTTLSLQATAPRGYIVQSVEAEMNGESVSVSKDGDVYSLINKAPDSGSTVITVKYALDTTPYTLIYRYQGRKGGNEGSYVGDDSEYDEKTYSVTLDLTAVQMSEGVPTARTLIENAPAVEDLYKDCIWTIDDGQVVYDTENNTVTLTAVQTGKDYTVEFRYNNETLRVQRVKLNSLVMPNNAFVEAPASDGSNPFAYWSVAEDGKEIARCYNREFNLRVTGDCTVTACYGATAKAVTISEAEYSREQSTDVGGNTTDKLYADFILAYMEKDGKLLNPSYDNHTDDDYQTGLIVEYDRNIVLEKADAPGATLGDEEKVVYPDGDTLSSADAQTLANGGALSGAGHSYLVYSVANNGYNNHNRVDRAISFINSETARHLVLRAYYYVWNKTTGEFEMTEPVYFYLYDIGNSVASN